MDTKMEDTMVHQIERNLSDNMKENLFLNGGAARGNRVLSENHYLYSKTAPTDAEDQPVQEIPADYPLVSNDYISNPSGISRAEYIRQAREACLRQLSTISLYSRPYEVNNIETEAAVNEQMNQKKANVMKLFHNDTENEAIHSKETTKREIFGYRSFIIRCVCAIALFVSIYLMDKFDVQMGKLTQKAIEEYVTGNDALKQIENFIVTWLK